MELTVKSFDELSLTELYALLQLRADIFVVEQKCIYLDIDGKDEKALHVMGFKNAVLIAYARIFPPGEYFEEPAIGRLLVKRSERGKAFAHHILEYAINVTKEYFHSSAIKLSAQAHLRKFYGSHGFQQMGEGYLEDGIPHVAMVKAIGNELEP